MSHKPPNKRMEDGRDRSLNPFSFHGRRNFSLSSEIKRKMNDNETLATSLPNGSLAFVEPIERPRERESRFLRCKLGFYFSERKMTEREKASIEDYSWMSSTTSNFLDSLFMMELDSGKYF